ncbi:hypothetical protein [Microvirga brassicacearum]|uniref:P-type ATPase n=1 Tax=Microvirga brassicacearum TaxID=2580413 RepID=UPI0030845418
MIAPNAFVLRGGQRTKIAVRDLVPGDIVFLEAGDRVPADLRLLRARRLLIDEALLTGESVAAENDEAPVPAEADLRDRRDMAFSGTLVAAGQATGVTVETAMGTQIGRISRLLQTVEPLSTPLLRQLDQFARRFTCELGCHQPGFEAPDSCASALYPAFSASDLVGKGAMRRLQSISSTHQPSGTRRHQPIWTSPFTAIKA